MNHGHEKCKQSIVGCFEGFTSFKDAEKSFSGSLSLFMQKPAPIPPKKTNRTDLSHLFGEV